MAKESFFSRLRDSFFGKDEVELNESIETTENTLPDPEIQKSPAVEITPKVAQGAAEVAASFFSESPVNRRQDNELKPTRDPARLEHEPYRFNEGGDMKVCITKANLYEIHPKTGAIKIHPLKDDIVEVTRDCVVCSYFSTDNQGHVVSDYEIVVQQGKQIPASTHFILPDEDDGLADDGQTYDPDSYGSGGEYYTPLFWIIDGKIERNNWEGPNRKAKLWGGIQGHRGPLWWIAGYNKLKNIGGGKNIYKEYDLDEDEKRLRTLKEKGQSTLTSPFSGEAQVRVRYDGEDDVAEGEEFDKANSDAILVHGNRYNKQWFVGERSMGIVEDGLVTCLANLSVTTVPVTELSTALAAKAGTLTDIVTASTTTEVVGSLTYGSVAGQPTSSDKETAITGLATDTTFWKGGSSIRAAGLTVYEVQLCNQTGCGVGKSVYVMGVSPEGYQGSASWPYLLVAPTQAAAVTGSTGETEFLKSVPSASVVTGSVTATVVASATTTQAYLPTETVRVYQAEDENSKKFLTYEGSETGLTFVIEPTSDGCTGPQA